jgi:periplasmic protein CpxP/Spy
MRRKLALGTMGLMVLLGAAIVWAQDAPPQGPGPAPRQGQMGDGQHKWGDGARRFDGQHRFDGGRDGQFGRQRWGGGRPGMHRMGMQGRRGFGARGGGLARLAENPRMRAELGLTDEQVSRLHQISVDAEKASIQTRADMQLHRLELRELMRADNPDESAIMAKMDQINALQGKMQKARVQTMLSARGVLTADQIKKLKAMRENHGPGGPGGGRMMHGGPHRPGGPGATAPKPQEPPVQ